ncbi:MAG: DUF2293 domain-containing protein [Chloroflexi bacterium]|nr:DUF2293 domain-containing protein [Chloroflexota bacterium]MBL6960253.1 DUF2293 domain-containing protein [Anaerolineales bacterium]
MDLKVFITNQDSTCDECGEKLGHHAWITLVENKGALCLSCADLDHLVFLPAGSAALTRRSAKYSTLSAVVLQWSRARKHYERQGLLVEEAALQRAEQECLEDADVRARRNERQAERRDELDQEYVSSFAKRVHELFPNCPAGREQIIAEHACQKYSGRVGRSAQAKSLDEKSILLAVIAHIRHAETNYDELLAQGMERSLARDEVQHDIERIIACWKAD